VLLNPDASSFTDCCRATIRWPRPDTARTHHFIGADGASSARNSYRMRSWIVWPQADEDRVAGVRQRSAAIESEIDAERNLPREAPYRGRWKNSALRISLRSNPAAITSVGRRWRGQWKHASPRSLIRWCPGFRQHALQIATSLPPHSSELQSEPRIGGHRLPLQTPGRHRPPHTWQHCGTGHQIA
jgi:hypothetical protein